jgi:hypothetical protein
MGLCCASRAGVRTCGRVARLTRSPSPRASVIRTVRVRRVVGDSPLFRSRRFQRVVICAVSAREAARIEPRPPDYVKCAPVVTLILVCCAIAFAAGYDPVAGRGPTSLTLSE